MRYADAAAVAAGFRTLTDEEQARADALLEEAAVLIDAVAADAKEDAKWVVSCRMVRRVLGDGTGGDMPLDEMIPAAEPNPVLVLIMKILEYILLIALAGGLIFGVIYGCIRISRGFKTSFVDRRDLVENLPEDERTTVRERAQKRDRPGFLDRSPTAAVRRKYRKTLLHAAKEPPARWMSPAEAEVHAKLQNDALHIVYEKARYSEKGCTKDDLTAI